jgi:hypothetical protein
LLLEFSCIGRLCFAHRTLLFLSYHISLLLPPKFGTIPNYDCPRLWVWEGGPCVRVVIATHPATDDPPKVGQQRHDVVYELFVSTVQPPVMTANDLLDLYLHRGSFETVLADEDGEQDPDRWCSHTSCGQEFWQILSQWVWNLRLECGQHCSPTQLRTTIFASANEPVPASEPAEVNQTQEADAPPSVSRPAGGSSAVWKSDLAYGPAQWARSSYTGGFAGSEFLAQADGTLLCPAGRVLTLVECRQERAGSVRVAYSACLDDCRACHVRAQCQNRRTHKARRVSAVYWPLSSPSLPAPHPPAACSPVLWRDWPRRGIRRQWISIVRSQSVTISREPTPASDTSPELSSPLFTRPQRAHWRFSWEQRLSCNARPPSAPLVTITLHGLPTAFAQIYGFELLQAS